MSTVLAMILNFPLQHLLVSQLDIGLNADGHMSCRFKPNPHDRTDFLAHEGLILNLESLQTGEGHMISFSASPDESYLLSTPGDSSPALDDLWSTTSGTSLQVQETAPQHYSSAYSEAVSSFLLQDGDLDFDPASEVNARHFSELMQTVPVAYADYQLDRNEVALLSPLPIDSDMCSPSNSHSDPASPSNLTFIATNWSSPEKRFLEQTPSKSKRSAQYPCLHPRCERVLTSPYTRQVHMRTHRVKPTFLCTMGCGEDFTRQHDRERHEVALHGKKCKHTCKRCKRFFSSDKMLLRHVCRGNKQGAIRWPLDDDCKPDVE
ncbi:hypothetical protein FB45DRAFT_1062232 [Roridomyces roridus]|uniref:C2H2-type domain-containing protein n=1 Tax=Roridomyces roridus TaxID=1738132 RepID=A0AAD7BHV8_9AGAR|nr:hypothetical protein FB45DRAFT_1062232 [Roridomyces roridus]